MDLPMATSKSSAVPAVAAITPIDPDQILTLSELAERLKVSERWVYEKTRRRSQNPLPTIRIGRYLRFDWISVSAWLRQQERVA
jgi:excisionase family DNA binding protein